jgi:hypothetical protein
MHLRANTADVRPPHDARHAFPTRPACPAPHRAARLPEFADPPPPSLPHRFSRRRSAGGVRRNACSRGDRRGCSRPLLEAIASTPPAQCLCRRRPRSAACPCLRQSLKERGKSEPCHSACVSSAEGGTNWWARVSVLPVLALSASGAQLAIDRATDHHPESESDPARACAQPQPLNVVCR